MLQSDENNKTGTVATVDNLKTELSQAEWPKEGSVVEATLIKKMTRKAYFEMGRFGSGILYGVEFLNAKEILKTLSPGESTNAKILNLDGEGGYIELSLAEAGKQKLWQQIKELQELGEVIKVRIVGANVGGLMATIPNIDLKAFLPVSQLSLDHYPRVAETERQKITEELKKFVGEELSVKILDANPRNSKLIISEREVLSANVKEQIEKYKVGDLVDGLVSGVADFGAFVRFVDNPQVEGMIHISELGHRLIDNPKEIVNVNDQIKVQIIEIRDGKVFLSLKALQEDPWKNIEEKYKSGEEVAGKVYKLNPFGAVITIKGDIQGLIHVSEFGGQDELKKSLELGKEYRFMIDTVKPTEKRITLKLKK